LRNQQKRSSSKEEKVLNLVTKFDQLFDQLLEDLVRATYDRASDAAHRFKPREEVAKLLKYFEVFAHDLLDLE
jgi:hypothetical protein